MDIEANHHPSPNNPHTRGAYTIRHPREAPQRIHNPNPRTRHVHLIKERGRKGRESRP